MRPGDAQGLLNPGIRDEAAQWFVAFCEEEVDARVCQQFNDWLRRSPEHVRAYLRISAFWEDAGDLSKHAHHRADEIAQRAIAESNVVPFSEELKNQAPDMHALAGKGWRHSRWHESVGRRRSVFASFLAAGFACAGLLTWLLMDRMVVYSTAPGERRTLTLTDGSTVELNARSRIRVAYSSTGRDVELLEGQALFKVARSPSRPFVVHSGDSSVRAVGTQFDVNRSHGAMIVTVVEGRVAVTNGRQLDRHTRAGGRGFMHDHGYLFAVGPHGADHQWSWSLRRWGQRRVGRGRRARVDGQRIQRPLRRSRRSRRRPVHDLRAVRRHTALIPRSSFADRTTTRVDARRSCNGIRIVE